MENRIHHLADVQSSRIGEGTNIWQFCVVLKEARIGNNCNINCNVFIENDVLIGNNVTIKPGVQIWDGVTIEDNVFIGPNVTFTNDLVPRSKSESWELKKITVKTGATIGANSTLLAGIVVGEYAFLGAGSVLTKNVPPYTIWYGNPAKHTGFITRKGILLNLDLLDPKSGKKYFYTNNEIHE
ncbi:acyltransferase [Pedobacter gandavensis]|uniref:acyltransferase n=1 Tax=Pedobacter gandavensis TaxID=2679963 RepID=UPI0029318C2D|nr:acyltransferase [Pedobacter gandavensis]